MVGILFTYHIPLTLRTIVFSFFVPEGEGLVIRIFPGRSSFDSSLWWKKLQKYLLINASFLLNAEFYRSPQNRSIPELDFSF